MTEYYLAVDIGASIGRHILGHMEQGRMVMEEMHRFYNGLTVKDGEACWDLEQLFEEIKTGLKKCREAGKIPVSMGIDTWAVDFVLLDDTDKVLGNAVGYRDKRTEGTDRLVYEVLPEQELYGRTGIQKQIFNTIYQLMAVKKKHPECLEKASAMLLVPDYFQFLLTGRKASEYTNATTTQLVSPKTKDWDFELIEMLGYPRRIFQPVVKPGTVLGNFTEEIQREVGFDCQVILPATHDTGSAVLAVPSNEDKTLYISSGTWSLMGVERKEADCSEKSRGLNFTNEGGYDYRFRYLKNIMGLWMIQSVRHELGDKYSFAQLCDMAEAESDFPSRVDVNDDAFLAPDNMTEAIKAYCRKHGWREPETTGQIAAVIYQSLAESYAETVREIEALTGRTFPAINIVGGGSNAAYLNQLTADKSGRCVYAGPGEATAIGNLAVQMLKDGKFEGLAQVRACIYDSFGVKKYEAR